ncbi:MAG TPA: hypothetical protein PKY82_03420 [Pyrinomonadaceae bacterium]|nr:hypothetical protein [Pyrinomonadaceae bacterium]
MPLEQDMINILQNQKTRQISFSFTSSVGGTVTVNYSTFQRIIQGLQNSRFEVTDQGTPPGGAAYNPNPTKSGKSGKFKINPNGGIQVAFESLVVHESVHASFDLTRSTLPWVDNEAAAHLAQGYYYYLSNVSPNIITFEPVRIARQLAEYIADSGFMHGQNLQELRNSLLAAQPYQRYIHGTSVGSG